MVREVDAGREHLPGVPGRARNMAEDMEYSRYARTPTAERFRLLAATGPAAGLSGWFLSLLPLLVMTRLLVFSALVLALGSCNQKATEAAGSTATTPEANTAVAAPDPAQLNGTWTVASLNGTPLTADSAPRPAQLIFDAAAGRVSGSTSCNRLMGTYTATSSTIRFGQVGSTRMACLGPNVEQQMLTMLNTQDLSYELTTGGQLTLSSGGAPVAVLTRAVAAEATGKASQSWVGTYAGTLPCPDCKGIQTQLTLNADETYSLSTTYLGKGQGKPTFAGGRFSWDEAGRTVRLEGVGSQPAQYQVNEKTLTQLDASGQPVGGSLADKYVLRKQ